MDVRKAVDVMCFFASRVVGELSDVKLMKLMYFADKKALLETGFPITDDAYFLMNRGPILSHSLDMISKYHDTSLFAEYFEKPVSTQEGGYRVKVLNMKSDVKCSEEDFAPLEVQILEDIIEELGSMSTNEIVVYAHDSSNCPEWKHPNGSSHPLSIDRILVSNAVSNEDAREIISEVKYHNRIQ